MWRHKVKLSHVTKNYIKMCTFEKLEVENVWNFSLKWIQNTLRLNERLLLTLWAEDVNVFLIKQPRTAAPTWQTCTWPKAAASLSTTWSSTSHRPSTRCGTTWPTPLGEQRADFFETWIFMCLLKLLISFKCGCIAHFLF